MKSWTLLSDCHFRRIRLKSPLRIQNLLFSLLTLIVGWILPVKRFILLLDVYISVLSVWKRNWFWLYQRHSKYYSWTYKSGLGSEEQLFLIWRATPLLLGYASWFSKFYNWLISSVNFVSENPVMLFEHRHRLIKHLSVRECCKCYGLWPTVGYLFHRTN